MAGFSLKTFNPKSSDDPIFDDIRPCHDDEVQTELEKIFSDEAVLDGILRFRYHRVLARHFSWLLRPFIRSYLRRKYGKFTSIHEFQRVVADFMTHVIRTTTDGVTYRGFDRLDPHEHYLFISNHRDISLDPAFVDMALFGANLETVRIAIGDNLLKLPSATSLMRLNKSFIVKRSAVAPREKLEALTKLSAYIGLSIQDGHNIWIAEREGRAKDGDDRAEPAVLKMIYMYGRMLKLSFPEYVRRLNIVPVSITYEYDPSDVAKARELMEREANNGVYAKGELEDLESIWSGIKGYKGRVSVVAGAPFRDGFETPEELCALIDRFIYENYQLYPSALLSAGRTTGVKEDERQKFEERMAKCPDELQSRVLDMYARPVRNLENLQQAGMPVAEGRGV